MLHFKLRGAFYDSNWGVKRSDTFKGPVAHSKHAGFLDARFYPLKLRYISALLRHIYAISEPECVFTERLLFLRVLQVSLRCVEEKSVCSGRVLMIIIKE
jgi:hypothetical protein